MDEPYGSSYVLPESRMPEAEVAIRLAHHLVESGLATAQVRVSIDGAQVRVGTRKVFEIEEFLSILGWVRQGHGDGWQAEYSHVDHDTGLTIDSKSGQGDVSATLATGGRLVVECKKGPLRRSKSSPEYPLLREALGQVLTIEPSENEPIGEDVIPAVAVPNSEKFAELARRWRRAPLVVRTGIQILLVDRENGVDGFQAAIAGVATGDN